jgi:endonuclease YncB( thermonuclease family)
VIAVYFKGETNLNAWMVAQGWAVTYWKYGNDYISQEEEAALPAAEYVERTGIAGR